MAKRQMTESREPETENRRLVAENREHISDARGRMALSMAQKEEARKLGR